MSTRLYQSAGFSKPNQNNVQHGIIKQHPDDHPDESERGQKYLHPLEHHEIESHGDKPSIGSSNGKLRQITTGEGEHHTKVNSVVHKYNPLTNTVFHNQTNDSNIEHLKAAHHHTVSNHSTEDAHIITTHHSPDISRVNHHLGFGDEHTLPSGKIVQYAKIKNKSTQPVTREQYLNS